MINNPLSLSLSLAFKSNYIYARRKKWTNTHFTTKKTSVCSYFTPNHTENTT